MLRTIRSTALFTMAALLLAGTHARAQRRVYQPPLGSAERNAFLNAHLRKPDGSPMDFQGACYADCEHHSDGVDALLHRIGGRWRVVAYALCPTDVEWGGWSSRYHAPRGIFPQTS